jgi:hypothetical protein
MLFGSRALMIDSQYVFSKEGILDELRSDRSNTEEIQTGAL